MAGLGLRLDDGREVVPGEPTVGGSKNETRYSELGDGQPVVVKIETVHGRLRVEWAALTFASRHGLPVPRPVGRGTTPDGRLFLVLSREDGVRTVTPAGWHRLGRDLAALARVPVDGCPLDRVPPAEFVRDHRDRLGVVEHLLAPPVVRRIAAAVERLGGVDTPVLTHGDPGGGNYLDAGRSGVILDWETATVAPFGLDIGRAMFIGLMDLGHSGRPVELSAAVLDGYRDGLGISGDADPELVDASVVVAGLQFVHRRLVRPLRPDRTPQGAAATLDSYLARG